MGKQLVDNGDSGLLSRTKINENATELYDEDVEIGGIKTHTSFPVTPSLAPTSDYQVANKKYVDDNAGGGEYQIYNLILWGDSSSTPNYMARINLEFGSTPEYNFNTTIVSATGTMLDIPLATLKNMTYAGVSKAAQTITGFLINLRGSTVTIPYVSIIKVDTPVNPTVITSIAILFEGATTADAQGNIFIPAASFTETAIEKGMKVYVLLNFNTTNNVSPCFYELTTILD